ncbi:MAG: class I SAM-dependent methyltransferase [Bacteroidetes bacterium]|nr:class I SAM-dependent methyltransferase [Bacteroidota bacterium]MBL6963744.1 class I SAM-dependent methyltransferase [Bacteroidota bacterium]
MLKAKEYQKICDCQSGIKRFTKNSFSIYDCQICKHRFAKVDKDLHQHISETYNDLYFYGGNDGYPDYLLDKEILINRGKYYSKILNKLINTGKVLDIGSASGFVLKGFTEMDWDGVGVEPNKSMAEYGRSELNLNIHNTSFEEFESEEKFDLIIMIQVIGHFYDLHKVLNKSHQLLKDDGLILVESWDRDSRVARLFGESWHEYSPPSVLHWFSIKSIQSVFEQHGLKAIKFGRPLKNLSIKHASSLLEGKSKSRLLKNLYNILGNSILGKFTFLYAPLDLFWMIFNKKKYE